jgi:hypothetical protein
MAQIRDVTQSRFSGVYGWLADREEEARFALATIVLRCKAVPRPCLRGCVPELCAERVSGR